MGRATGTCHGDKGLVGKGHASGQATDSYMTIRLPPSLSPAARAAGASGPRRTGPQVPARRSGRRRTPHRAGQRGPQQPCQRMMRRRAADPAATKESARSPASRPAQVYTKRAGNYGDRRPAPSLRSTRRSRNAVPLPPWSWHTSTSNVSTPSCICCRVARIVLIEPVGRCRWRDIRVRSNV